MGGDKEIRVARVGQSETEELDRVAVEETMQLVVDGRPVAVLMRTPGHDGELAAGFLWTEGIVGSRDQIRRIDVESRDNHALVFMEDGVVGVLKRGRWAAR